jgi:hypothetical protein
MVRPGVYFRTTNAGGAPAGMVPQGTVAVLFRSSWGPLGAGSPIAGDNRAVAAVYGTGGTTTAAVQALLGGAQYVLPVRIGTGGTKASLVLKDTNVAPVNVVTLTAAYVGARSLAVTLRDSLSDATKRELLILSGSEVLQKVEFAKGGTGEIDALVAAVAAYPNSVVVATKQAAGTGLLAVVNQQALTGGADPTVTMAEYSAALADIEALDWNVLAVDTDDAATQTTVAAYVDRVIRNGKRVLTVVGEPSSVAWATRMTNAKAFNHPAVIYCANGFTTAAGSVEGYLAAARVAGMVAAGAVTKSYTHEVITGATGIVDTLTAPEIEEACNSGALSFTLSAKRQVIIEKGINTLVSLSADQDAGWKKIRRTRTRYNLQDRVAVRWADLVGKIDNNKDGRATLIQAAQADINAMIGEGALLAGTIIEDPANPPSGDSAWFLFQVDDLDSAERLYGTFGFRFSA